MGSKALNAAVLAEGRARIDALLTEARAGATHLREQAEATAARRHNEALRQEEARLRREASARIAETRSVAQRRVLEAREALLERVFARAMEALPATMASEETRERFAKRVEEALHYMPVGPVTITCSADLAPALERTLAGRNNIQIKCDPALAPGFRAMGAGGALTVDATLPKLLELHRTELAVATLLRLEAGADT